MVLLGLEQASLIFRQCAVAPRHHLTPRSFFLATRSISWGKTQAQPGVGSKAQLPHRRRPIGRKVIQAKQLLGLPTTTDEAPKPIRHADPEEQVAVNYFEADAQDKSQKEQINIGDLEKMDEDLEEQERGIDERIRDLENDVNESVFADIPDAFANSLFGSKEERKQLIKHISDHWDELGKLPHQIDSWEGLPQHDHVFIKNINGALTDVSLNPSSDQARIQLWRWYARCKIYIKDFLPHVPDEAWQLLWQSQSEDSPHNPNRASHLKVLADDMVKVGHGMTQEQRYSRLEGMFMNGQQDTALEEWEKAFKNGDATTPAFLELGLRMYAYKGNVTRTMELNGFLLAITDYWNRDIFLAVLTAILGNVSKSTASLQAHQHYTKMRKRFRNDLVMEDYDAISLAFLKGGHRKLALMVFRDMMLAGDAAEEKPSSFVQQIRDRIADLLKAGKSADKVNAFMLDNVVYLPRQYQNKFFFAKWLRKLISMNELDAAAMVVELMYERGINPDALHVNGLIGAWLRQDVPETRKKAEDMAWAMIQTRLDFVTKRRQRANPLATITAHSVQNVEVEDTHGPKWNVRRTPSATIETFCIMMKHHLHNEDFTTMRHLRNLLTRAELKMNSVFMNHLLYVELQCRTFSHVWQRFDYMSREVVADVETWICLWEVEKQEILESDNPHADFHNGTKVRYPKPRQLFARMMQWSDNLSGNHRRDALEDMELDTYNDILRCFCLTRDLTGAFVAMREMTRRFEVWPGPSTIRMLILQISKMATVRNRPGRRILAPGKAQVEQNVAKTTEVLDVITQYRRDHLVQKGVDFEQDFDEAKQAEETLRTLLQFVFTLSKRMAKAPAPFQVELDAATRDMGVEHMDGETAMDLVV